MTIKNPTIHRCRLLIVPLCAASLALGACGDGSDDQTTPSDVADRAAETADAAGDLITQEVNEFRENMQREIAQLNREIELLNDRAGSIAEDAREGYENTMQDLRERRDALELRLVDFEVSTQTAWIEIRSGLERSWQELTEALASARDRFGDSEY